VHCHFVTRVDDLARERGPLRDLLPDEEEGREGAVARKLLEHGRGAFGVRPVVERQRDSVLRVEPALDPVSGSEARHVRGERRDEPVDYHATSASTSEAADGSAPSAMPGAGRDVNAARNA